MNAPIIIRRGEPGRPIILGIAIRGRGFVWLLRRGHRSHNPFHGPSVAGQFGPVAWAFRREVAK